MTDKYGVARFLVNRSRLIILILLMAFFSLATDNFWSMGNWTNLSNVMLQQAPFLIMLSLAMTAVIIISGIDLSIGTSISLTAYCAAVILQETGNSLLAIVVALALGAAIGAVNGVLISKVGLAPFVATFSMQWICKGAALVVSNGAQVYDLGPTYRYLFNSWAYTYIAIAVAFTAVLWVIFSHTTYGRKIYYIGANREAARMSGMNVDRIMISVFALAGVVAAATGLMYVANLGGAEPTMGDSFPLKAIAAALVGGTALGGAKGKISNAFVGGLIMVVLQNGMIHVGVPAVWQDVVQGVIIVLAIMLERGLEKIPLAESSEKGQARASAA